MAIIFIYSMYITLSDVDKMIRLSVWLLYRVDDRCASELTPSSCRSPAHKCGHSSRRTVLCVATLRRLTTSAGLELYSRSRSFST